MLLSLTRINDDCVEESLATNNRHNILGYFIQFLPKDHSQSLRVLCQPLLLTHLSINYICQSITPVNHSELSASLSSHPYQSFTAVNHSHLSIICTCQSFTYLNHSHISIIHISRSFTLVNHTHWAALPANKSLMHSSFKFP